MEPDMLAYATTFRDTFLTRYKQMIEPEYYPQLGYLDLLEEGRFIGLFSSTYGSGYEWRGGPGSWEVRRGEESINRLFAPFHHGSPSTTHGLEVGGEGTSLEYCTIQDGATLTVQDQGSVFVWRSRLEGNSALHLQGEWPEVVIAESEIGNGFGRRFVNLAVLRGSNAASDWSESMAASAADNALLRARVEILLDRESRRPYQNLANNSVLLLGDFSPEGRARLAVIEAAVRRGGWKPVYVDQFDDIGRQDIRSKVLTLASICRFVIMDDSSKAGQLTEVPLVEQARTPTAILRLQGSRSSAMTRGIGGAYSSIQTYEYTEADLEEVVDHATMVAEEMVREIERDLNREYRAWRSNPVPVDRPRYGLSPMVRQSYS